MNERTARLRNFKEFIYDHYETLTSKEAMLVTYYYIRMEYAINKAAKQTRKIGRFYKKLDDLSMTVNFRKQLNSLL